MNAVRQLVHIVDAQPASDGAGVKIHRLAGRHLNRALDPFLLIDEINSEDGADYIAGFPEHPHRGFETITYIKQGRLRHKDHMGNEGVLAGGGVQWMTAGRGIIHSEMPEQSEGLLQGFQLWLNLPADQKMKPAAYADYVHEQLPVIDLAGLGSVKIIAGEYIDNKDERHQSPIPQGDTDAICWDVSLAAGADFEQTLPSDNHVAVYVYEGSSTELTYRQLGIYQQGDTLKLKAGDEGLKALVVGGKPLKEPIAQYGPFVMNTPEQIEQALQDYQQGKLVASK
ncbi:MAG: redox-sensitive bicupin YhaK (pirin superfamily) [Pseudohongiellaceae bacterium]|jgi:redox-sensitive bicupin YhaK (pirin superfamily)